MTEVKVIVGATKAWSMAQAALNVILSLNPIGIVVMAVAALVGILVAAYNNSESFRRICDQLWAGIKRLSQTVWDSLVAAFEAASAVIKKAWEWVKKFFKISDESNAREVAGELDRQAAATEGVAEASEEAAKSGLKAAESVDWQTMSYQRLGNAIETQKVKVAELAGVNAKKAAAEAAVLKQMESRYKALGKQYGLGDKGTEFDGKTLIANAQSYKALGNNIAYYQAQLDKTAVTETAEIQRLSGLIMQLTKAQAAIKQLQAAYSQPAELTTLDEIDAAIEYQQSLRGRATADQIAGIDAEIQRLNDIKTAFEDAGHASLELGEIKTYAELGRELEWYEGRLQRATETERAELAQNVEALKRLRAEWDLTLMAQGVPGKLETLDDAEKAMAYYEARMRAASGAELAELAKQKLAIEAKKAAMERPVTMARMDSELEKLQGLEGVALQMKLELVGLDGIKSKIRQLQDMLADTTNPLTEEERENADGLLKKWQEYEKQLNKNSVAQRGLAAGAELAGGLRDAVSSLGGAIGETAAAWLGYVSDALSSIAKLIPAIKAMTMAHAMDSAAQTPLVGWLTVGTAAAAVVSSFASLPKFADGGIAYGPTLGLFGEYAGASSNPEVVAPLSRLKELMGVPGGGGGQEGGVIARAEIEGRKLVLLLERELKLRDRS